MCPQTNSMCSWHSHMSPLRSYTIAFSAFHHEEPVFASWRVNHVPGLTSCGPACRPLVRCGQIFHTPPPSTPARMHLLPSQTQSPGLWVPNCYGPQPPCVIRLAMMFGHGLFASLFFAKHCSTDPVCLNPLDVTLMDYRGGVHGGGVCMRLDEEGASDRKCCAREAAEQREVNSGRVISSCRHVAGSKLIWCCYVTVIIILYNHISSFV